MLAQPARPGRLAPREFTEQLAPRVQVALRELREPPAQLVQWEATELTARPEQPVLREQPDRPERMA
jgi:hypothetical protein